MGSKGVPLDTYGNTSVDLSDLFQLFGCNKEKNFPFWDGEKQCLKEEYSCGGKYKYPLELMAAYQKIHDRVERLCRFSHGENGAYVFDAIPSFISEIKELHGISLDMHYDCELFYACLVAAEVYGEVDSAESYIFIDEFQDLSSTELKCISLIFLTQFLICLVI